MTPVPETVPGTVLTRKWADIALWLAIMFGVLPLVGWLVPIWRSAFPTTRVLLLLGISVAWNAIALLLASRVERLEHAATFTALIERSRARLTPAELAAKVRANGEQETPLLAAFRAPMTRDQWRAIEEIARQ